MFSFFIFLSAHDRNLSKKKGSLHGSGCLCESEESETKTFCKGDKIEYIRKKQTTMQKTLYFFALNTVLLFYILLLKQYITLVMSQIPHHVIGMLSCECIFASVYFC